MSTFENIEAKDQKVDQEVEKESRYESTLASSTHENVMVDTADDKNIEFDHLNKEQIQNDCSPSPKSLNRKNSTTSENSYREEIKDKVSELSSSLSYIDQKALSRTFHFTGNQIAQNTQGVRRATQNEQSKIQLKQVGATEGTKLMGDGTIYRRSSQADSKNTYAQMSPADKLKLEQEALFQKVQLKLIKYIEKGEEEKFITTVKKLEKF